MHKYTFIVTYTTYILPFCTNILLYKHILHIYPSKLHKYTFIVTHTTYIFFQTAQIYIYSNTYTIYILPNYTNIHI